MATISPETRKNELLKLLDREGECSIEVLAEQFGVSGMTIRRDLQELSEEGRVIRTHGGATSTRRVSFEFRFLERAQQHAKEKAEIAKCAVALIKPGQSVLLDSGTTTLAIAKRLPSIGSLTVVTTSLPIASELFGRVGIEVVLLGGTLRQESPDLTGALTDHSLDLIRADVAFIGADAVDVEGNIYNASSDIGRMLGRMAKAADRVYAVADHTKVGQHELMRFARLQEWNGLISDTGLEISLGKQLQENGVHTLLPGEVDTDG